MRMIRVGILHADDWIDRGSAATYGVRRRAQSLGPKPDISTEKLQSGQLAGMCPISGRRMGGFAACWRSS